jgi:hypothetical protein
LFFFLLLSGKVVELKHLYEWLDFKNSEQEFKNG